jgi:hypothetical protein
MTDTIHWYDDADVDGLDEMSMQLPVTDSSASKHAELPLVLGKGPEWWVDEKDGIESGEAVKAFGPSKDHIPVPDERMREARIAMLETFGEEHEDAIDQIDHDLLDVGEGLLVAYASCHFKNIDGWVLASYTFELLDEKELIEFMASPA